MEELNIKPSFDVLDTEERKFFKNQMSPKELVQYFLYLQKEGKLITNATSTDDSSIPDCITATFYYPTDVDYYYDKIVFKVYLTNNVVDNYRQIPDNKNYNRIIDDKIAGAYLGWSATPGEREFYQDFYNLYPAADVIYRNDLKNPWKKVSYPYLFKMWSDKDDRGVRVYAKPRFKGSATIYDFILAKDRHIGCISYTNNSSLINTYRKQFSGDCLLVKKLDGNKVNFTMTYRRPTNRQASTMNIKDVLEGITLDIDKMMAEVPENEKPVAKETSDGLFKEGDIILAKDGWESYDTDWFYINSIDTENNNAELIKLEKEVFEVGRPSSTYSVYARPKWRYEKTKIPKMTDEKFIATYTPENKDLKWKAPELSGYSYSINKYEGGDVKVEWVDYSG